MKLPLLCLLLCLSTLPAQAGTFAGREDVQAFINDMQTRHGLDGDMLGELFARTRPIPAVLKAIAPPPDPAAVRSWRLYRSRFVEPKRIAAGRQFMTTHASTLARAEAHYGVPRSVIAAIIGVETIYGRNVGRFNTFAALATLAFDYPPRADLFRRELESLLLLAREENRSPMSFKGSYAGALGLPQFLPSSIRSYATDFDGDGRIDLQTSPADAIGSVAKFLHDHGWQTGGVIALPVRVEGNPQVLIDEGIRPARLPSEMAAYGVDAGDSPAAAAALIDLVTPQSETEYWLGYQNFWVITRYNRSSFYAMSVMQLAQALEQK
jgi:membrane-bound lytic murein transglycosylase B